MRYYGRVIAFNLIAILIVIFLFELGARALGFTPIRGWDKAARATCDRYMANYRKPYPAHREYYRVGADALPQKQRRDMYSNRVFDKTRPVDILLIGDSFTNGNNARPGSNSFSHLIEKKFNTKTIGIPGIDSGRYRIIAEKYVPQFKPRLVIVAFYVGNDLRREIDHLLPHTQLYWTARHPWVVNYDDWGRPFGSEHRALEYVLARDCDKQVASSLIRRIQFESVAYKIFLDMLHDRRSRPPKEAIRIIQGNMERIDRVARRHGARLFVALVPTRPERRRFIWSNTDFARRVLKKYKMIKIDDALLDAAKYGVGDKVTDNIHFNNAGHRVFADQIIGFIEREKLLAE